MNKFNTWLWPDRSIGKRESRQLREEHNALVNSSDALIAALQGILAITDRKHIAWDAAHAALKKAGAGPAQALAEETSLISLWASIYGVWPCPRTAQGIKAAGA